MLDLVEKYVIGPWTTIWSTAPVPFVMSVAAVGIIIFVMMKWGYGREISLLRAQVADYKEKLSGATPAEAKAQLLALEARVQELAENHWPPLSEDQSRTIERQLAGLPKHPIDIVYTGSDGIRLARSFHELFRRLDWPTETESGTLWGIGAGISISPADEIGKALERTLDENTNLVVRAVGDGSRRPEQPTSVCIGSKPI